MAGSFRVRIRSRAKADGRWEVETVHGQLESAVEAALFANGLRAESPRRLWLGSGVLNVELCTGRRMAAEGEVQIWRLGDGPPSVPEVARFEKVELSLLELSTRGLDGEFEPREFLVVDPLGNAVDAELEVDPKRQVVRVKVLESDESIDDGVPFGTVGTA